LSDARWALVFEDARDAVLHLTNAVRLYEEGGFSGNSLNAYRSRMAFMHAVQAGHTSLEAALLRILDILDEENPTGDQWHRDLISHAGRELGGENARPAILPADLARHADETRRFRNLATRSYGSFDPEKAIFTVTAARQLAEGLIPALTAFCVAVDPAEPHS
jgi:hypothetical protein